MMNFGKSKNSVGLKPYAVLGFAEINYFSMIINECPTFLECAQGMLGNKMLIFLDLPKK
jgi:hypothetical protein